MPQTTVAIKMTLTKSLRLRRRVPLVFILKNGLYAKYVDVY
jgi:ribosomal protein L39E